MSINVNVSGNPVRITRGKLITANPDNAKKEFDKRRRMRLEQVRHQSKEIAEKVRNKVRGEKKKQLTDFEKQEEEKLKLWQNRKLLELQQQYCESLKNIGLGHSQAIAESTQEDVEEEFRDRLKEKAEGRGIVAEQRLRAGRTKQNLNEAISKQHKKLSRDIENARAAMVSKGKKTPPKKRKKTAKTDINITTNVLSDSVSQSDDEDISELNLESDDCHCSVSETRRSGATRKRTKSRSPTPTSYEVSRSPSPARNKIAQAVKHQQKSHIKKAEKSRPGSPKRQKSPLHSIPESEPIAHYPEDTRISDRIKNRRYLLNPTQICEPSHSLDEEECKTTIHSEPYRPVDKTTSTTAFTQHHVDGRTCNCKCTCCYENLDKEEEEPKQQSNLPEKPTISLKTVSKNGKSRDKSVPKVQYYDHSNRFSKEYLSSKQNVERIPEESIEIRSPAESEAQYMERTYKNDRDAEIRGKKAMEKLNIHKDYKEMMKQLPVLQKQERIASISGDKPIYHMSDKRLKEYQRNKQNTMENAYETNFPKSITIPPKRHISDEEPFKTIDVSDADRSLNVAQWDVDKEYDNGFTLTKDSGAILIEADSNCANKEDYLKYLLERLKLQKKMLLREMATLPKDSNLNNIIDGLEGKTGTETQLTASQRAGQLSPLREAADSTTSVYDSKTPEMKSSKHKRMRQTILSTSNSSINSSPSKKRKHKLYKIILQNTSTQTSPKPIINKISDKENTQDLSCTEESCPAKSEVSVKSQSPKRGSGRNVSSRKSEKTPKTKVSRSISPVKFLSKDQASSPINAPSKDQETSKSTIAEQQEKRKHVNKMHKCKCDNHNLEDKHDLCEILIKIKDNEEPEITRLTKRVVVKELAEKESENKGQAIEEVHKRKGKPSAGRMVKISEKPKATSWREQFSKNGTATSTSTSYFSPPDYSKSDFSRMPQAESTAKAPLRETKIDPRLLTYIKKLLSMSRTSVEDLGMSSVSEMSSLSGSVLNSKTRTGSLNQLRSVIKYFNLNPDELAHYLSYSEDTEITSGSIFDINQSSPSTIPSSGYEGGRSQPIDASISSNDQSKQKNTTNNEFKVSSEIQDAQTIPSPVVKYAELAELCQKRISDLAGMIERVRIEKQQILSPLHSDKENSTQYLGLPSQLLEKSPNIAQDSSTNSELEQSEINRKMLEIDYELAKRLKAMTPKEIVEHNKRFEIKLSAFEDLDKDLLERYRKLADVPEEDDAHKEEITVRTVNLTENENKKSQVSQSPDTVNFVPLLSDIPRLPKLVPNQEHVEATYSDKRHENHKKPPPAKGLIVAKKFNENITTLPHELSTIVEVDSQLSTKLRASVSPRPKSNVDSPKQAFDNINPVIVLPEFYTNWPEKSHKPDEKKTTSDGSMPDIVAEIAVNTEQVGTKEKATHERIEEVPISSNRMAKTEPMYDRNITTFTARVFPDQSTDSSTEKSEVDNIEAMLKSMGMGWAVSTLRTTQAALNRVSSSSSSLDSKEILSNNSSTVDVTLRDVLGKKLFSSSSMSISPNLSKFLNELSAIHGSRISSENKHQRTSTPVQTTKSSDSKKGIFTAESEVSSVKVSDDNYVTMRDTTGNNSD